MSRGGSKIGRYLLQYMTLRVRFSLWSVGLLLVLSAILVVFINTTASVTSPPTIDRVALPEPYPLTQTPSPIEAHFGQTVVAVNPSITMSLPPAVIEQVQDATLQQVRSISIIGLILVAVVGGGGAYWLAGQALRPIRDLSYAVHQINADNLDSRIYLSGPEDEIKKLADDFNTLLVKLQRAFEQQGRFVSDAAHELRTPLATIRTNLEVIQNNPDSTLDDYRDMGITLERSLTRLERLVGDLLLLTTEERLLQKSEVTLIPLLEDVLTDLKPLAHSRQITLQLIAKNDILVEGNESLLARVFSNLIENGIRYNRPAGNVVVTLDRVGTEAEITIADTGRGIPLEEQSRIFERFYRIDQSRDQHTGRFGLGLSIVAHIVEQHHGSIQLYSQMGIGSTFVVRLPKAISSQPIEI